MESSTERARQIDTEVKSLVVEYEEIKLHASKNFTVLALRMREMYQLFEAKDPRTKLIGFQTFNQWREKRIPVIERSQAYAYMGIIQSLENVLSETQMTELGPEKCKSLVRLKRVKGSIPENFTSKAKKMTAAEVREEVAIMVNP